MAELCRKCFIETWRPNAYDIEHIVMSKDNKFCEGCMDCVPYVDYIDTTDLRFTPTADDFFEIAKTEVMENERNIACPECGSIFEEDDLAYAHYTGLCQYCHISVDTVWIKD